MAEVFYTSEGQPYCLLEGRPSEVLPHWFNPWHWVAVVVIVGVCVCWPGWRR